MTNTLKTVEAAFEVIAKHMDHSREEEKNIINALEQICQALNMSFQSSGDYMNYSSALLRNIATCMIPFINEIKECAVEDDDYEKAMECMHIIQNLEQLINVK